MSRISHTKTEEEKKVFEVESEAKEIFKKNGKDALIKFLDEIFNDEKRTVVEKSTIIQRDENTVFLHCPNCGFKFSHNIETNGKFTGLIGGATVGGVLGSSIGIAGAFGAISGTLPAVIIVGFLGKLFGENFDKPKCVKCSVKFHIPSDIKPECTKNLVIKVKHKIKVKSVDEIIEQVKDDELEDKIFEMKHGRPRIFKSEEFRELLKEKAKEFVEKRNKKL